MLSANLVTALWIFILPLIAILLPIWLGQRFGLFASRRSNKLADAPINSAVAGSLGLFAFMLAFTFQIVGDRFSKRRELFLNEVSEIRTSYLYAGLIPEPTRSQARKMIVSYVDVRVQLLHDISLLKEAEIKSQKILDSLWSYAETLSAQDRSSESYSLFTSSVSQMISLFNERITVTLQTKLPQMILYVLAFVGFFSMLSLGFYFGITGKVSFAINLVFAITFAAVMWLIFALDNPEVGLIQVDQSALVRLRGELR